ncbi:glycoside hydrolase family 32 protein [Pelomonas sp. KK5]|uniref:glycoside hydrolase family 32 protein n=1 Tax=Pelomonas sp. KK5 TaxID=1855730 RepID=UPI00097C51AD|nr:glycoside hydrolase family 32 protein [Pelomonas sp. KK5]
MNSNTVMTASPDEPTEAWRPRYHYAPERNWMNDPNGLVWLDGEYHLFYQYNPEGDDWGHISWGHAVSTDLVSWQELPVAIPATERMMAFSGCAVVDHGNTTGFAPPGATTPPLLAFFTGFDPETKIQSQHLAYSLDRGRTFTPYAGNPILDIGSTEFRDPKVFWHAASGAWVMLVVAALEQQVWFYRSSDLIHWTRVSTFGPAGSADDNIWEVPELFELPVDDDPQNRRWVLIVSVNRGSLWGGSGVQYFTGDFDGTRFVAEPSGCSGPAIADLTLWADHGRDFYAPITFANMPDDRVVWMGWVSNWEYARELPTRPWRGQQSAPRELSLVTTSRGIRLRQRMVGEMLSLLEPEPLFSLSAQRGEDAANALSLAEITGRQLMARMIVNALCLQSPVGLEFFKDDAQSLRVGFDPASNSFFIDRRCKDALFPGQSERHDARRLSGAPELELEVWIDGSMVEVLADGGTVALTDLAYGTATAMGVGFFSRDGIEVQSLELRGVRPSLR